MIFPNFKKFKVYYGTAPYMSNFRYAATIENDEATVKAYTDNLSNQGNDVLIRSEGDTKVNVYYRPIIPEESQSETFLNIQRRRRGGVTEGSL